MGLCWRCEHRARYLEDGLRPRYECGEDGRSVSCCYMYLPMRPCVVKRSEGDDRPEFGMPMIAARMDVVRVSAADEMHLRLEHVGDGVIPYWIPY